MDLIVLGNSGSGKDTIAKSLGWKNRKFSQFAKDWLDSIFGGNFESDRYRKLEGNTTKDEIMVALYHLLKPTNASVEYARRHWNWQDKTDYVYTDVRAESELFLLLGTCRDLRVLLLPGGQAKTSDSTLRRLLELSHDHKLTVYYWEGDHPASYSRQELKQKLTQLLGV